MLGVKCLFNLLAHYPYYRRTINSTETLFGDSASSSDHVVIYGIVLKYDDELKMLSCTQPVDDSDSLLQARDGRCDNHCVITPKADTTLKTHMCLFRDDKHDTDPNGDTRLAISHRFYQGSVFRQRCRLCIRLIPGLIHGLTITTSHTFLLVVFLHVGLGFTLK